MAAPWEEYKPTATTEQAPWDEPSKPVSQAPAKASAEAAPWDSPAKVEPEDDRGVVGFVGDRAKGAVAGFTDVGYAALEGVAAAVGAATGDNDFARAVSDYRSYAKDFYAGDVPEDVKDSFSYKASAAIGAMPAYAAAAATGPVGWGFLLATGSQAGRDDYLNTQGVTTETATEEQLSEANKVGAMTAVPMMLLEKFGAGKLVNAVFKGGGKLTAKEVASRVAKASISEGATESLQTGMQNTIASQIAKFDPDREISQDVLESMALGAIASGGIAGAGNVTQAAVNRLQGGIAEGDINPNEMNSELGQGLMSSAVDSNSIPEVGSSSARKPVTKAKSVLDNFIRPISSQFKAISPALHREVRQMERRIGSETNKHMDKVEPFARGLTKIRKASPEDYRIITSALFNNSNPAGLESILNKYELTNAFGDVRQTLDAIKSEASGVGIDAAYIDDYFPRKQKDHEGFRQSFGKEVPAGVFERMVLEREKTTGKPMTSEDKAILFEQFAKNTIARGVGQGKPDHMESRTVNFISDDKLQFYERPEVELIRYIENMVNSVETKKMVGATELDGERTAGRLGQVIEEEYSKGKLSDEDAKMIQKLVESRFGRKSEQWGIIRGAKNAGYLATMGNFGSAVTQLGDFAFSAYQNGLMPTGKALFSKKDINLKDIGVDPNMVTIEANEGGKLHHAVNKVFQMTGLTALDRLAKNTNINAAYNVLQKQAKSPLNSKQHSKLMNRLEKLQGADRFKTMADLKNGVKSELVLEVLYNQIADVAPISLSEMPMAYANNPNGRIAYQLKSYTIKQLDFLRQESFSKMASGNKKEAIEGFKNLMTYATVAMAANASADVIKDIIFNREIDPEDIMWDNMLRLFGTNRYATQKAGRKGVGTFLLDMIKPAQVDIADNIYRDVKDARRIEDARSTKYFPLVGKLYDRWLGRGSRQTESYK